VKVGHNRYSNTPIDNVHAVASDYCTAYW